jgi:hypothetical protein
VRFLSRYVQSLFMEVFLFYHFFFILKDMFVWVKFFLYWHTRLCFVSVLPFEFLHMLSVPWHAIFFFIHLIVLFFTLLKSWFECWKCFEL